MMKVKLVTFVPLDYADAVRDALGKAGAGVIGEYSYCSFSVMGIGRYIPSDNATPFIGENGVLERVEEERVEVVCDRKDAKNILTALRTSHPYEEVAVDIYELIDENSI